MGNSDFVLHGGRQMKRRALFAVTIVFIALFANSVQAEPRVEKNVVYGMYSGLALLMDVHYPDKPNGYGLLLIPGSGWHAPQGYDAIALKDGAECCNSLFVFIPSLLRSGYTLFIINHRAAPRFRFPAAVEDAQRAVRFVRSHAKDYGISAERIGAVGYSSGAHLVTMLGVLDGSGNSTDPDPVNRLSARVQCVVANALRADLRSASGVTISFVGQPPANAIGGQDPIATEAYRVASPISHVTRASAPLLLIHGDADNAIPLQQSEAMLTAMQQAGAPVKLIRVPGGGHDFAREVSQHPEWPNVFGESVRWLDDHLKAATAK
jgi:dienelactone hydrolase